jgi:Nitrile hydratase, alpha chain
MMEYYASLGLSQFDKRYVSKEYKQRIVNEPRKHLADYGLKLDDDVEIRVYDITADIH